MAERRIALAAGLACVSAAFPAGARGASLCPDRGDVRAEVTVVEARLELRLSDGRRLRLVGIDPAQRTPENPDLDERGRAALAAALGGRAITVRLLSDKPDRWGRLPAQAFLTDGADSGIEGGLAALAVARGLARVLSEPSAAGCREALLAAETHARAASLGLWHDPYYGVLAVDDRDAFRERSATGVVAEGRLWRVDAGPFRTKLRFAAPGREKRGLLVAVVSPRTIKRFEDNGVHFEALIGRTLRLRGLLDLRFGPQVELAGPDALEILPEAQPATAAVP